MKFRYDEISKKELLNLETRYLLFCLFLADLCSPDIMVIALYTYYGPYTLVKSLLL